MATAPDEPDPDGPAPRDPDPDGPAPGRELPGAEESPPARRDASGLEPGALGRPSHEEPPTQPPKPFTQYVGRAAIVLLVVLVGFFAAANSQPVDFSWVFGETRVATDPRGGVTGGVPLIVLILAAFVLGALLGALLEWQFLRARRARRAAREP